MQPPTITTAVYEHYVKLESAQGWIEQPAGGGMDRQTRWGGGKKPQTDTRAGTDGHA